MKISHRRLACSLVFAALAAVAATGCSGSPGADGEPAVPGEVSQVVPKTVDAETIAALPAGQKLVVDVSRPDVAYDFDYSRAPIDFSRVTLHFAEGHDLSMSDWLEKTATDEGDVVALNPQHFVLRPVSSVSSSEKTPELVDPVSGGGSCVTFCMWVCETEHGPCVYKCITNCP